MKLNLTSWWQSPNARWIILAGLAMILVSVLTVAAQESHRLATCIAIVSVWTLWGQFVWRLAAWADRENAERLRSGSPSD